MSNRKEIQTSNGHIARYLGDIIGISIKGKRGFIILTPEEIDEIHGLKEANRK